MRRQSRKLSGPALARYLRRFFANAPELPPEAAERLAARGIATFTSVRVRGTALRSPLPVTVAQRHSAPEPVAATAAARPAPPDAPAPAQAPAAFDPYAIGLVPTFQREGRDGLITKLAAIASTADLRKMARAQNIVLPETLRASDVAADALRIAIADAVAKRIADRRAAAG